MTATTPQTEKLAVREVEAAKMLGVSPSTLKRLRMQKKGPPFKQPGGGGVVMYPIDGLREWLKT